MNAPSPPVQSSLIKVETNVHIETESDDDYLDDYLYDQNSLSSDSDSDDEQYLSAALKKSNSQRGATSAEIESLPKSTVNKKIDGVCAICL